MKNLQYHDPLINEEALIEEYAKVKLKKRKADIVLTRKKLVSVLSQRYNWTLDQIAKFLHIPKKRVKKYKTMA